MTPLASDRPAESLYAPPRRSSGEGRFPSNHKTVTAMLLSLTRTGNNRTKTLAVGLFLLILRYWKEFALVLKNPSQLPSPAVLWTLVRARLLGSSSRNGCDMTSNQSPLKSKTVVQPLVVSLLVWIRERIDPVIVRLLQTTKSTTTTTRMASPCRSLSGPERIEEEEEAGDLSEGLGEEKKEEQSTNNLAVGPIQVKDDTGAASEHNKDDTESQVVLAPLPPCRNRFRQNKQLIYQVLRFWFGKDNEGPDELQKKLWMASAHLPTDARQEVDKEITTKFSAILVELAVPATMRWSEWCGYYVDQGSKEEGAEPTRHQDDDLYGYQGKLAAIIVLDQFSRHIHRYMTENGAESVKLSQYIPDQSVLDDLAHTTAQLFVDQHETEIEAGMIPSPMYIFALMPFRHASTQESVAFVQDQVESIGHINQQYDNMLRRFRKATNRRMAVIQDEARRVGKSTQESCPCGADHEPEFKDEDILECEAFRADMAPSQYHVVHETICSFLQDRGIFPVSSKNGQMLEDGERIPAPIVISLSGGVDSMVILSVLAYLKNHCDYPHLNVTAVHIDYANRPESAAEADYVRRYCQQHGVTFLCRRIDEVTRGVTARDEYETISRQVRYDFYRNTVADCKKLLAEKTGAVEADKVKVGVVLGHHRGDLRENVLSNAHKGCGPLDLSGMTPVSTNDGVTIYRPLLPLEKNAVYDYAHKFGVPYFKDTTPHWSTRGKLRNKLLPLLQEIYGEGSMNNLSNLAVESDECRTLLYKVALGPFLDRVERRHMGICFGTQEWKYQGFFFWKFVLRETLHSAGIGMFSDKSVASFLSRIQANRVREGWLQCRKDCGVYLRWDGKVFVLFSSSFPWRDADRYKYDEDVVLYGPENAVTVGPWRVTARRQLHQVFDAEELHERLAVKAIPSMDDFMDGSIEYYIEARTWQTEDGSFEPRPLVFTSFTKQTRPRAWKNADAKIQDRLPLLGNDDKAVAALTDPIGCKAVHTSPEGEVVENPVLLVKVTIRLAKFYPTSP